MPSPHQLNRRRRGVVLILSMIFVLLFSGLAVSLASLSGSNVQLASNQHQANTALYAAQSGLECAKYLVNTVSLDNTNMNFVTEAQADQVWTDLCQYVRDEALDGQTVPSASRFSDGGVAGDQLLTPTMGLGSSNVSFTIRFYRYDADVRTIKMQSVGTSGAITRSIGIDMDVTKDAEVLKYAIASRGRMWLTGDTTIHGDLYSSWDRADISPFNTTSETSVEGTINTVLNITEIDNEGEFEMETLDGDDNPLFAFDQTVYDAEGNALSDTMGTIDGDACLTDTDGSPVYDENGNRISVDFGNRIYSTDDELQGYHENVNYGQPAGTDIPGMNISDYNTDGYTAGLTEIGECPSDDRTTEYFPHAAGDYAERKSSSSHTYSRHVYVGQTFTNATLPPNRHALFIDCTFEEVLYVDTSTSSTRQSNCNNIRFQDCTFNGVIVTDVPQSMDWVDNCLYFTGGATFSNQSSVQEATILAPHFNVNLGNTNPNQGDNNVLTGAIVGGIVDVRGNAEIYGTIISMYDTTPHSSGYVTNIGATLGDGGSETTELGDIGVISITPEEDMMLPSGITSPIIIKTDNGTYSESA